MTHRTRILRFPIVALFALLALGSVPVSGATKIHPTGRAVPDEVLVKIQGGASSEDMAAIEHSADVDHGERIAGLQSGTIWRLHSRSKNTEALRTALQKNPKVLYAEPNYIVQATTTPNDPLYPQLWGLSNTGLNLGSGGVAGADISAEAAWGITTGSASIVVGVVDTGIDYTHPDLAPNVWSNPGGKGNAACAAGTHGFNAITKTCDPKDDAYHGTHVSGTIGAAGNNNQGVTGGNWVTSIMGL
jgi:subtilisin family serine protease